jgi:two-component system, cell cycle sensor histidine kinase and response regulator CckA
MRRDYPLSIRVKWWIVVATVLLHPVMLWLMLPVFGEISNVVGVVGPALATLLVGWRVGLAVTVLNVAVSAGIFTYLTRMTTGEGVPKAVVSTAVIGAICFGAEKLRRYVEQRRAIEQQLNQAKKMEAVGRLAGGVAHDINNILNSIMASVVAHRQELNSHARSLQDLDNIVAACERGSQLIRNLLGFARKSNYKRQNVSLNDVIDSVHALLKRTADKNIQIEILLDGQRPAILGDRGQVESAVMNLCINALDAMGDTGTLTMTTGKDGDRAFLSVRDTGIGMDDDVKEHVFEPFFTTKPEGKGTGLGLSMVYGVVHAMSGRIALDTAPGKGTCFSLLFPAAPAGAIPSATESAPMPVASPSQLSGRSVLLIDDEPMVLRSSARMLRALGFNVLSAESGRQGAELLREDAHAVDLVIVDLIMPEMDGIAAIGVLRDIKPSVPVILVSGYTGESERLDSIRERHDAVRFLPKPYNSQELINAAKELLGGETTSRGNVASGVP